jgi:lambda family phage portal protein
MGRFRDAWRVLTHGTRDEVPSLSGGRRAYDGASAGARTNNWQAIGSSANAETSLSLDVLRNRTRDLVRNNAWSRRAIDALVSNLVGTGIRPIPCTGDKALDRLLMDLWDAWGRACYPLSRQGIYGVESLIARSFFESGEVLVRKRNRRIDDLGPDLPPLQLQVLEGDFMPTWKNVVWSPDQGGNRIVQGVEIDALDRRAGYWLLPVHPGGAWSIAGGCGAFAPNRVDAADVLHLMQEARPGQVRGVPWLAPVIMALWDLGGMADAERARAKVAHCLTAFVESIDSEDGTPPRPDGITSAEDENGNLVQDMNGNPVEQLHPGLIAYLPPGKKVNINSPSLPSGYDVYQRVGLHEIAAGVGLAYEVLTGDLSQVNFSSIRLGLNEQNRMVRALREQVFVPLAMQPIWEWFCEAGQFAGLLTLEAGAFPCRWSSPRVESVDRKTDAEADLREMRNSTRSRRDVIASYGQDPDAVDAEIALDQENRKRLGIVSDGDPGEVSLSGAAQSSTTTAPIPDVAARH